MVGFYLVVVGKIEIFPTPPSTPQYQVCGFSRILARELLDQLATLNLQISRSISLTLLEPNRTDKAVYINTDKGDVESVCLIIMLSACVTYLRYAVPFTPTHSTLITPILAYHHTHTLTPTLHTHTHQTHTHHTHTRISSHPHSSHTQSTDGNWQPTIIKETATLINKVHRGQLQLK